MEGCTSCGRQAYRGVHTSSYRCVLSMLVSAVMLQMVTSDDWVSKDFKDFNLKHLVWDSDGGGLYVGAVNRLYRINSTTLAELDSASTGPKLDDLEYDPHTNVSACNDCKLTPNTNKVLVIDSQNKHVITCGSVYQGSCEVRQMRDLSSAEAYRSTDEYYVAANDPDKSTVAFIGPIENGQQSLYVGTTKTGHSLHDAPAVSSRQLSGSNVFQYSFENKADASGSFIEIKSPDFEVSYKTGFSSNGYSYFLTNQKQDPTQTAIISKVIQVCQNANNFKHAYVEMNLECKSNNADYGLVQGGVLVKPGSDLAREMGITTQDDILVAIFTQSGDNAQTKSAICAYSIKSLRNKAKDNFQACFDNETLKTGAQFASDGIGAECFAYTVNIPEDYCGTEQLNSPLSGSIPMTARPLVTFSDQASLTAIAVDVVYDSQTVAFVGTSDGKLKRVLLSAASREISQLQVHSSAISQDLVLSPQHWLYVMTDHKISRVPLQSCGKATSCADCTALNDPYCGWCSLEKKCSVKSECTDVTLDKRWVTGASRCIQIDEISPDKANIHHPTTVVLTVEHLPPSAGDLKCEFRKNGVTFSSATAVTGQKVHCDSPGNQSGLDITDDLDHINVSLGIRSIATDVEFLSHDFTLYSCSIHKSCGTCAVSTFPCMWCLHDDQCRDQSQPCLEGNNIVAGNKNQCPVLREPANPYLLPEGVAQDIELKGTNLPSNQPYKCRLENATFTGEHQDSETVLCKNVKYTQLAGREDQNLTMKLAWKSPGNGIEIDGKVTVTSFSCRNIAQDCSACQIKPKANYNCKWCDSESCVYQDECSNTVEQCPPGEITKVFPTTIPKDGDTLVTIEGNNLGQRQSDIQSISIQNVPCVITDYEISRKIVCKTGRYDEATENDNTKLEINYLFLGGTATMAYTDIKYKDPQLTDISPKYGPQSGGTKVVITGSELDTGATIKIIIGNSQCEVNSRQDRVLNCTTLPFEDTGEMKQVRVTFDGVDRSFTRARVQAFDVYPDPIIQKIEPTRMFESGGRVITVSGNYLDSVEEPRMQLVKGEFTSEATLCDMVSSEVLKCPSPRIMLNQTTSAQTVRRRRRRQTPDNVFQLQLVMDAVRCTRNVSGCYEINNNVTLYADPLYDLFVDGVKVFEGDTLTLTGTRLDTASSIEDIRVTIGAEPCKVEKVDDTKLWCTPPKVLPRGVTENRPPKVRVRVGNIDVTLGELKYSKKALDEVWIIIMAVGGGILITIIIIVVVVYKRRSADIERQNKKLQIQLDTLESNVRNECKQAFAELQTEVSDFTSDLNVVGIPFWDYKMYTFRVLFPGLKDHPVLHGNTKSMQSKFGGYEQGLHQFNQLLNSKQFLLIFIRTLEQQKNFSIRDKSVVASLLMIVLQDKMEYATEILKSLLNELIDKSVDKKHPKLMLRRTESVVEKLLSNWLSLSMYVYLKKHAGKVLFMLFKAIKHQTEKGPVDVFTSEAKYSLSEDRLLREKVNPKTLTLHVLMGDMKEPVTFKAMDQDTVTQAKEKALDAIYMNSPFSPRPSVYDVDLEWRSGRSGHLPLQDEDVTTQVVHGWKRVNSLAHYHVADGATLVLVPSKQKGDMVRQKHGMIEITNSQSSLPPIVTVEEGTKVWHLVKHDDNQNVPRTQKVISEIFLTRLLATKGTLQQYIDDLFITILRADSALPPAVKYLFDFLDNAARRHNIVDPDVVYTWKSNSLPLRFWVNIIKNPEFIFDIYKSNIVDSCLSVTAQTFMDSCSTAEHRLGKDSPSNKLLFAKDIPRYRSWVNKFYKNVADMPPISDQEMTRVMTEMSMTNITDFNVSVALQDLYKYAMQYNFELLEALDEDPSAKRLHLANRFEQVQAVIEGTPLY